MLKESCLVGKGGGGGKNETAGQARVMVAEWLAGKAEVRSKVVTESEQW